MSDWNPCFKDYKKGIIIFYEKNWYCVENKIIHNKEKDYLKCKFCNNIDNTK